MATHDQKLSDPEVGYKPDKDQETAFNEVDESTRFIEEKKPNGDVQLVEKVNPAEDFYGLSREELEKYASDPKWVKVRWILFIIFVVCWVLMLVAAIVIVVITPKCPPMPNLKWYESGVMYKLNVEKFQDSDADGKGDLKGVQDRMDHFTELNVKTLWFTSEFVSKTDLNEPKDGTKEQFKTLAKSLKKKGMRTLIDLDLTAVSVNSDLYRKSESKQETFDDFLVWSDDSGAGWKSSSRRGQSYQLYPNSELAELNLLSDKLQSYLQMVFRGWVEAGAEGFVLRLPESAKDVYGGLVDKWQSILDEEYNKKDDRDRVIIAAAGQEKKTPVMLYEPLANCTGDAKQCVIKQMESLNFASGRGEEPWNILQMRRVDVPICDLVLRLTMPGTPNLIYGDEIGLTGLVDERGYMLWDDTSLHGFTANSTFQLPADQKGSSVLAEKSAGYTDTSFYKTFKTLAEIRSKEPSLKWGSIEVHEFADEAVAFVRKATGLPPVVVALNPSDSGKSGKLSSGDFTMGEVLYVSGSNLEVGSKLDMSAVYVPSHGALVARLEQAPKEK